MDLLEAQAVLVNLATGSENDEVREAVATVMARLGGTPPNALGSAHHGATSLANQIYKTGAASQWATPPDHSKAMELLVHRLTTLLEAMLDLLHEAQQPNKDDFNARSREN